jgi:hypothetical protein
VINHNKEIHMIVRFTTSDGKQRTGYVTRNSGDGYRVCTAPGVYFSVPKDQVQYV